MDEEIRQNFIKYEAIKQKVFTAFADVRLGDSIGFREADAIDGYLSSTSEEYKKEKELDERIDLKKVYEFAKGFKLDLCCRHHHMDARGLYFYLPVFLLLGDPDAKETVLRDLVDGKDAKYLDLMNLLTLEHKKCIIEYMEYSVDYDDWVKFYVDFKGHECHKCGKIHVPESYTYEQAKQEVESGDEYILLQYLKKHFNL